jgi:hypothetical protein
MSACLPCQPAYLVFCRLQGLALIEVDFLPTNMPWPIYFSLISMKAMLPHQQENHPLLNLS